MKKMGLMRMIKIYGKDSFSTCNTSSGIKRSHINKRIVVTDRVIYATNIDSTEINKLEWEYVSKTSKNVVAASSRFLSPYGGTVLQFYDSGSVVSIHDKNGFLFSRDHNFNQKLRELDSWYEARDLEKSISKSQTPFKARSKSI